jgi:hypothetical protein
MTTYLVYGFDREDYQKRVCIVLDAGDGSEAFAAARALNPTNRFCFNSSENLSGNIPEELKNRLLEESELYAVIPSLNPARAARRRRRR